MVTCPLCEGSGSSPVEAQHGDPPEDRPCPVCFGEGEFAEAHGSFNGIEVTVLVMLDMLRSIQDSLPGDNVVYSYQVVEAMDVTEYNALSEAYKAAFAQLLSHGHVDLSEGAIGRASLWLWFGAESTTVASLLALIA